MFLPLLDPHQKSLGVWYVSPKMLILTVWQLLWALFSLLLPLAGPPPGLGVYDLLGLFLETGSSWYVLILSTVLVIWKGRYVLIAFICWTESSQVFYTYLCETYSGTYFIHWSTDKIMQHVKESLNVTWCVQNFKDYFWTRFILICYRHTNEQDPFLCIICSTLN